MHVAVEIVISVLLVTGSLLALIGSFGLLKLRDFYLRLHGPTKASTLGLGGILMGSAVFFSFTESRLSLHEILISLFLFITAPVSAHVLAKTALHHRLAYTGDQPDPMDHPHNVGVAPAFPDPEDEPAPRSERLEAVAALDAPAARKESRRRP